MMLPLEFWQLGKIGDGRAVLYFTESQYNEVRSALEKAASGSGGRGTDD